MTRADWEKREKAWQQAHAQTGIGLKDWCEQNGLNFATARRYIRVRKSAQKPRETAQKKVRRSAQPKTAKGRCDKALEEGDLQENDEENCANASETKRNSRGGNAQPVCRFTERNTAAVKHRGYAKYLDADNLIDDAADMALIDELVFTRARALSVTTTLKKMFADLAVAESVDARIALYGNIMQAEQALDRNIARIESIERTLNALEVGSAMVPKLVAETARLKRAAEKLKAETDVLTRQKRGAMTPMTTLVAELHALEQSGKINDFPEE